MSMYANTEQMETWSGNIQRERDRSRETNVSKTDLTFTETHQSFEVI